jgi:DNA primase
MSLPPGFLEELRNRVALSQVIGRRVTWDARKSNPGKGDMWASCPFHQEKSASFHVDDRKGFYYCFGCHAKGDAISFLRDAENMQFMDAVEALAREAGMPMPAQDPRAAERAEKGRGLADVTEAAVRYFRMQLSTGQAAAARDYLAGRGLDRAALDRFEIGFAPDSRTALFTHLRDAGTSADLIVDAGLAARPDDGGAPFDRFRGRIIFPIRDARGRCIGFGGRAMQEGARAKYLNSPETPLFDKGRSLYNHGPARTATGKGAPLIVVEGYMDVIALVSAGFEGAVAPLGTAITEEQLRMLWRVDPEPIIALDGDTAGLRAGLRLIDLALPMMEAGQALRFALMPAGQDPDDVLRKGGRGALDKILAEARPMVQLLWQRETEGRVLDSPERRATLDKSLRATLAKIADPGIRAHYADEIRRLRSDLYGQGARPRGRPFASNMGARGGWTTRATAAPLSVTRESALANAQGDDAEDLMCEAMILATCISHPVLVVEFEADLETLDLSNAEHEALRNALLRHAIPAPTAPDLRAILVTETGAALENLFALSHVTLAPMVRPTADCALARLCLAEELAKLAARRGARKEIIGAMQDIDGLADEGLTWRITQATEARHRSERSQLQDAADLGEDRAALLKHLQNLIKDEVWRKKIR